MTGRRREAEKTTENWRDRDWKKRDICGNVRRAFTWPRGFFPSAPRSCSLSVMSNSRWRERGCIIKEVWSGETERQRDENTEKGEEGSSNILYLLLSHHQPTKTKKTPWIPSTPTFSIPHLHNNVTPSSRPLLTGSSCTPHSCWGALCSQHKQMLFLRRKPPVLLYFCVNSAVNCSSDISPTDADSQTVAVDFFFPSSCEERGQEQVCIQGHKKVTDPAVFFFFFNIMMWILLQMCNFSVIVENCANVV